MKTRFPVLGLAARSLIARRASALLTAAAVALSVLLVLGVEELRQSTRSSFANTVAGTDLLVGPRTGGVNLLLYSVFRIGQPANNLSAASYERFASAPGVAWSIPLVLGDSYRGFAVVGTDEGYFRHYRYGRDRPLEFAAGRPFAGPGEAVLGATVARQLGHGSGDEIVIAHGVGATSFLRHESDPVTVVGVLGPTGTVTDRGIYVDLKTLESMHAAATPAFGAPPGRHDHGQADDAEITAFMLGLESRVQSLRLQREINDYAGEPLTAVIPAVALYELWSVIGIAESALLAVAALAVLTGLIGMLVAILGSLNERRREMAILRSVGAGPRQVFLLLMAEAGLLAGAGALLGIALKTVLLAALRGPVQARTGILFDDLLPGAADAAALGVVAVAGLALGLIPAWRAYRNSLTDGMTIRL